MSTRHIADDIYADSFPAGTADGSAATKIDGFRYREARAGRGPAEVAAGKREKQGERMRVYRHSIGRISKLRELQSRSKAG
jgi:hypothetical protein